MFDSFFRVQQTQLTGIEENEFYDNIYALGDCTHIISESCLLQLRWLQKEGLFLAKYFNKKIKNIYI